MEEKLFEPFKQSVVLTTPVLIDHPHHNSLFKRPFSSATVFETQRYPIITSTTHSYFFKEKPNHMSLPLTYTSCPDKDIEKDTFLNRISIDFPHPTTTDWIPPEHGDYSHVKTNYVILTLPQISKDCVSLACSSRVPHGVTSSQTF